MYTIYYKIIKKQNFIDSKRLTISAFLDSNKSLRFFDLIITDLGFGCFLYSIS
jgi:hypothetical protein